MDNSDKILHALRCAIDQNTAVLKPAEEWLKQMESDGNFYVTLSQICSNYDIEWTVRWLAIIYLKNGIEKQWRHDFQESLSLERKQTIKDSLCHCLYEIVDSIAIQVAVVITKIARFDYPKDWNDLIPFLLSGVSGNQNAVYRRRALLTLKHVVKMLSTKRLQNAKQQFANVCHNICDEVCRLWISSHDSLKQEINAAADPSKSGDVLVLADNHLLLTNLMGYMAKNCSRKKDLLNVVLSKVSEDILVAQLCKDQGKIGQKCAKAVIGMVKILDALVFACPDSFKYGAEQAMAMVCKNIHSHARVKCLSDDENEKFLVKCMNLVKSILDDDKFGDVFGGATGHDAALHQYVETLFQRLVSNYLPLTEENIESWEDDPEEFSNEEIGESWKFNLRPSAEVLVLTLLRKFSDVLVPLLIRMLDAVQDLNIADVSSLQSSNNPLLHSIMQDCSTPLECMVRKEAVYYTIGLGVYQVLDSINFEEWLLTKLMPEVRSIQRHVHGKLIHRRVLWLISQWAGIKPSDELRPVLYAFVVSSLDRNLDLAVRIAASVTIQSLLDDFEFHILVFKEYQDSCFQGLYNLLIETKNCDTKMRVLHVFSYLIERLGPHVVQYEEKIAGIIPSIWDHAVVEGHDMLKCAILSTMVQFITALGPKSSSISHLTIPLIKESTNLRNPSHVYLLEDGMELWLTTLCNCVSVTTELYGAFENIYCLLEYGSETLITCFKIIEAYVLLVGNDLLLLHGAGLDQSFYSLTTDVRNECLVLVSKLVCVMVEVSPPNSHIPCITYCEDALRRIFYEKDSVLLSANLTLMAEIILRNSTMFWQFLQNFSKIGGIDLDKTVHTLIKVWSDSIDAIVEIDRKKMSALALLTMLDVLCEVQAVANCFEEILCVCVQVLYDVCDEHHIDMLVSECEQDVFETEQEQEECPHDKRKRSLRQKTVMAGVSLPSFASEKLKLLQGAVPQAVFGQLISAVNPVTMQELKQFLTN